MKNLFDPASVREVRERALRLRPDSKRQWGKMNAAQAAAHCSASLEMALGDLRPPRVLAGRIMGPIVKRFALGNDEPMHRNSPTARDLVMSGEHDLDTERTRLVGLIDRFAVAGPGGCSSHPHPFFGKLTPPQWAELMYKHLDHHLRQFGV